MKSTLKALAQLILQNVEVLEADCEKRGIDIPSLDVPYVPGSDILNDDPMVIKSIDIITSAALQLVQTIRPAPFSILQNVAGHITAAAIRCAAELNVAEILTEAGAKGLHVKDIASKSNSDPNKIAPVLRALSSHWVFKEVQPDVFANNRLSSLLDKGLSLDEILKSPESKYAKPQSAISALVCHLTDEGAKATSFLFEALSDPATALSDEPNHCAVQKAYNTDKIVWDLMEQPERKAMLYRFGVAMEGAARLEPPEGAVKAFAWSTIPDGGLVVDVGGGIGTVSLAVAKAYPKLKFIVQDRPPVIADGKMRMESNADEIMSSGRVSFQAHDFFAPQPINNASVFFLKSILHDWSDTYARKILRNLRESATEDTRLFVMDRIVPYTCSSNMADDPNAIELSMEGVLKPELTYPLSNVSGGNPFPHLASMVMMTFMNGQERTLGHTIDLFREAGWKIVRVHQFDALGQLSSGIHAVPI